MNLRNEYRVVRDNYCGFEVQVRFWWLPKLWWQCEGTNTHTSLEAAKVFALDNAKRTVKPVVKKPVVFYLGRLP